jgi:hypothetical protein
MLASASAAMPACSACSMVKWPRRAGRHGLAVGDGAASSVATAKITMATSTRRRADAAPHVGTSKMRVHAAPVFEHHGELDGQRPRQQQFVDGQRAHRAARDCAPASRCAR